MKPFAIWILAAFCSIGMKGYSQKNEAIQISGVVITNDSLSQFVPNAHVALSGRNQGTMTNSEGFFSIPAIPGDTLRFSCLGFKREYLYVPDSLQQKGYLVRIVPRRDTTLLNEVILYPWPSPDQLQMALLTMHIPTTEMDIAKRNLAVEALKTRAEAMGYSAAEMQDYIIRVQERNIYNASRYYGSNGGTAILGALTNPFAWAEFFEALKRGDFSNK